MNLYLNFRFRVYLIIVFLFLFGCQDKKLYKDTRAMMGTFVEVVSPDKRAAQIAFREIARIEALLSKYNPQSEISRLNASGKIKASPETFYILKKAKWFCRESGGAFDVTAGALSDLWGFTEKNYSYPDDAQIKKSLRLVGCDKIILIEADNMVKLKTPGVKIDLGAIAKGFAVDCAVKELKKSGVESCLVNAGGQIYALGDKFGRPWRVAIRKPRGEGFNGYLLLEDRAVATSGDYEQYFIRQGQRYAHIFDPRRGYPADSGIASVTVTAPDGLAADALATIFFISGKAGAEGLLKTLQAEIVSVGDKSVDVKRF